MTIVDRYVLRLYFKVLVVCFLSVAGLIIVVDGFNNSDEFLIYGHGRIRDTAVVLAEYYGPRLLQFFDRIGAPLAMLAAAFVLTFMQRDNELTALMAAGIGPSRIVTPLIAASVAVAGLNAANREIGLPSVRDSLSRNAQDWLGTSGRKCAPRYDIRTEI